MKIVNISGGLGNQMFQYAFALSLKQKFSDEVVKVDVSHYNYLFFKRIGAINLHNGFEIHELFANASLPIATWRDILSVSWYVPNYYLSRCVRKVLPKRKTEVLPKRQLCHSYNPDVYLKQGDIYYEGYWESIQYYLPIRDIIFETYKHPEPNPINKHYIQEITSCNSVGVHIRRGDYLNHPLFRGICDEDYYREAINEILKIDKDYVFYVFSNDIRWCEEHLSPLVGSNRVVFVRENSGKDSCWDLFLMNYCKDLIIANSTFSWWGAFLNNQGGRIVAPKKWTNRNVDYDIWDSEWIRL